MPLELLQSDIAILNRDYGMNLNRNSQILNDAQRSKLAIAMDADYVGGTAQTSANGGIPSLLTTWVDPAFVEILLTELKMAKVFGEVKKGDRTTSSIMIPVVEASGETSAYGDFNNNGMSGANVNYVSRQPFAYQTNIRIGQVETEIAGEARIDWVAQHVNAATITLNKYQNQTYLYGVDGLQNYGMLNDPSLPAALTGVNWYSLTALATFNELQKLMGQLVTQGRGYVDENSPLTLLLSPAMAINLRKINDFGITVREMLKESFPNMTIESIPEYSTASGEYIQLILDSHNGRKTAEMGFTEKMRVGNVVLGLSGWEQKRSQTSLGAIIYYPMFVASMIASNTAP